jgi:hypothetical protein
MNELYKVTGEVKLALVRDSEPLTPVRSLVSNEISDSGFAHKNSWNHPIIQGFAKP